MRPRPRGTTLIELTVTIFLFSLMMTLILGFYIYGTRITDRRNTLSDNYRRAVRVADRIETLIGDAWIHEVGADYIIFSRLEEDGPISNRMANWSTQTCTLYVQPGRAPGVLNPDDPGESWRLWLREPTADGGTRTLRVDELDPSDLISFGDDRSPDTPRPPTDDDGVPIDGNPGGVDYVDVSMVITSRMEYKVMKPGEIGTGRPVQTLPLTRRILVERP